MRQIFMDKKYTLFGIAGLLALTLLIAGCGSASSDMAAKNVAVSNHSAASGQSYTTLPASSDKTQQGNAAPADPQYLIRTLKISMVVKDTRKVADDIGNWISITDPHSSSAGTNYQQTSNNLYNIDLNFSVQASIYPQVYLYLRDYTSHKGGRLDSFNETVQNVTGTYVDAQSRLKNLRVEQTRLQDLQSHAQALSDVITIEQRLTDVEGQIESLETQLNTLSSQTTYYTINLSLQPIDTAASLPSDNGWSISQSLHDAFGAALAFGQGLTTFLIWLLAFSIYIVPTIIGVWLIMRWRRRSQKTFYSSSTQPTPSSVHTPTPPAAPHRSTATTISKPLVTPTSNNRLATASPTLVKPSVNTELTTTEE